MPMGNLIKNVIAEYDNAPIDEIEERTVFNLQLLYQNFSDNPKLFTSILHSCINMAVGKKGSVNAKEDRFIKKIFKRITKPGQTVDTSVYSQKQSEAEKKFLELVGSGQAYGGTVGMAALRVILGFAFSDGILENDLAYQLETMFANCMVMTFFSGNEESVPVAGELISGLEVEIVEWLDEDELGKSDELYKHFSSYPRKQIQDALMSLENKGIISKADTYVGILYSLTGRPYRIANSESVSKNPGYRKDPEDLLEIIDFPVTKAIEGTGYEGRAQRFEKVHENDELILKADWNSKFYTPAAVEVFNAKGETLGYLADKGGRPNLGELAELVDSNLVKASVQSVTPLSKRRKNAKYALMDVLIERNDTAHSVDEKEVPQESESKGERRIVLDNNLVIYIPEGMNVSEKRFTTGSGISRLLTAATSDLSLKKRDNLDSPFDANRNITVNSMDVLGQLFMTQFDEKERIEQLKGFLGQGSKSIKNNGLNIIYLISSNQTIMMIFARDFLYMCQYFINDVKGKSKINQLVNDFIDKLELFEPKSSRKKTSNDHAVPSEPVKKPRTTTGNEFGKSRKTQKAKTLPKDYLDSNDSKKINAFKALELLTEHVCFIDKENISIDSEHELTGLNLSDNLSSIYAEVDEQWDVFSKAIFELVDYVNNNDNLRLPKNFVGKSLEEYTFGYDMSGSLIFNFAENGLFNISESKDLYIVEMDSVMAEGIPEAARYIAEFIKTLRLYNSHEKAFTVSCVVKQNNGPAVETAQKEPVMITVSKACRPYEGIAFGLKAKEAERIRRIEQDAQKVQVASELISNCDTVSVERGISILKELRGHQAADGLLPVAAAKLERLKAEEYGRGCELLAEEDITLAQAEQAAQMFRHVITYGDAGVKLKECTDLIRKLKTYNEVTVPETSSDLSELRSAISKLRTIADFRDAEQRIKDYEGQIQRVNDEAEKKRLAEEKKKTRNRILLVIAAILLGALIYYLVAVHPKQEYNRAVKAFEAGDYASAKAILTNMSDYENAEELLAECEKGISYENAQKLFSDGSFEEAGTAFEELGSYKDSADMVQKCTAETFLQQAALLAESGNYTDAVSTINQLKDLGLSEYDQAYNNTLGEIAVAAFDNNNLDAAAVAVGYMTDTSAIDSDKRADIEKAVAAKKAEEERKAREKEIADAYTELCEMNVSTSESIQRAEEILDLLPENYNDVADFIKVFNYYKPYLGRYTSTEYSSSKLFLRITSRKNRKWVVYIGDADSGAEFVYPSFTARDDFNSSIYDVWTIQSASTITRVSARNSNTFYYTYTR